MNYPLDANIPLPGNVVRGNRSRYPLADMQRGMSFFVPFTEGPTDVAVLQRVSMAVSRAHRAKWADGKRWVVRTDTSRLDNPGVRVWRVL